MRILQALGLIVISATGLAASASAAASAAPSNTSLPSISGAAKDGRLLTASRGGWTGSPTSYAFQWLRCDRSGGGCAAITGANSRDYTVAAADIGSTLRITVTATNADGNGSATSRHTGVVSATGSAPVPTRAPFLSGTNQAGSTLSANRGSWSGTGPIRFDYTWQRCDANGNNCITFIAHSGTTSYTLTGSDVGHTLRLEVTAYNSRGNRSIFSNPTAVISAAKPPATTVAIANVSLPDRLVIDKVSFSPNPVTSRSTAIVARFHVSDTRNLSVQGALVYALGLPYGWTYNAPEQVTDASGWATIVIQPTRNMPLRRGGALVLFVRARKPGDNLLAGVSTRRLVQEGIG
ncbi:MAG TPA: hypothetical protein VGG88_06080 [Gaiellaceae bacterium]